MFSIKIQEFIKKQLAVISNDNIDTCLLTEGRSCANVYRVKVTSRRERLTGSYVVKICDIPERKEKKEAYKANVLYQGAPDFSQHLVKVEAEAEVDGKTVIIYNQANNSVMDMVVFSELSGDALAKYVKQVSFDLLSLMNRDRKTDGTAGDFFHCLLAKQLEKNGRFESRIKNLLTEPEAESVVLNGKVFPNPFCFVKNVSKLQQCLSSQIFLKGMAHGDMHGYNLIASSDTYSLIDYDGVLEDAYLFYDQAYFEFSIFYDNSKDNDLKRWNIMLDHLISPSFLKEASLCENYKEYIVRNAICEGIKSWMKEERLEKMKDDIELQFLMTRIAAGINFFCKKNCTERGKQIKVLFYIAYCCKLFAEKTGYEYDENNISSLRVPPEYTDTEELWEGFVKFTNYVPVLITDDQYFGENCVNPENICAINWQLVIDIGLEQENFEIYKYLLKNCTTRTVRRIDVTSGKKAESFVNTLNILAIRKSAEKSYRSLWRDYKNAVTDSLKKLLSENPHVPLVFIFDCSSDAVAFKNQLINELCDLKLPEATRIVSLRTLFSKDIKEEISELENNHKWHFVEYQDANLVHVGLTCKTYLSQPGNATERSANLPAINGIYTFTDKDLSSFEECIELVYHGCERYRENSTSCNGFDMSGGGDSLGEAFYKGNEATWNDIANQRDLMLVDEVKYGGIREKLRKLLNDTSPRVKTTVLLHGAGSGGTTLSKHLLWDFKDEFPCARLKKYSSRTSEILTEIYRSTGKSILLSVESGSTVISDEELNRLKNAVDAENGRMVVLLIKRIANNSVGKEEKRNALCFLGDTMPIEPIARNFFETFSTFAKKKEYGGERLRLLEKITGDPKFKEQRSPFFYGFYTFQKEYQLVESLSKTVFGCSPKEKILLNALSLVTVFSQNICVAFSELNSLLDRHNDGGTENVYALLDSLPPAIFKLMTIRDNEGLRICHKVIAERILFLLHTPEKENPKIGDVVFKSAKMYIETMRELYDYDNEYVDNILKELIIDRAYIDSEERKTRFSILVESIPLWTDKRALFALLIEKFPNNPHYYNHLARLLALGDKNVGILPQYEKAVEEVGKAIEMAVSGREMHETTLGCIYGQWIINIIDSEKNNKESSRLHYKYSELISDISMRYSLAKAQFDNARDHTDVYDSFSFFPQINMECAIIRHLVAFDINRDLSHLIKEEPELREWYNEHFSVAVELYVKMREQLGDDVRLLKDAKNKLFEIAQNNDKIDEHFTKLLASDTPNDRRYRRSLAYTVFSINGCNWGRINDQTLHLMEQCFQKNVMANDTEHNQSDIGTWFEMYRRVDYFQAFKAQSFISDYMDDGYRKEYLLFLMSFIMRKEGVASASVEKVNRHIAEANRISRLNGLNTAKEHDAYVGGKTGKCPIVPLSDVDRDETGEPKGLEEFTGIVTEVEQTHGKILLDKLNLEVTFIPRPLSAADDPLRTFSRGYTGSVKLNIMFSYSGLRGWNVIKTNLND